MDNSIGTWKLNVEKSKYAPAPLPFKSQSTIRSASDGGVKVTSTGVQVDGKPSNSSYTVKYDGKDCPVTGAPFDTIAMKQVRRQYPYDYGEASRWEVPCDRSNRHL
jgi:hypothetical protein